MVQAMNTGHGGCLSTCHANGPADALRRAETMALWATPACRWRPSAARWPAPSTWSCTSCGPAGPAPGGGGGRGGRRSRVDRRELASAPSPTATASSPPASPPARRGAGLDGGVAPWPGRLGSWRWRVAGWRPAQPWPVAGSGGLACAPPCRAPRRPLGGPPGRAGPRRAVAWPRPGWWPGRRRLWRWPPRRPPSCHSAAPPPGPRAAGATTRCPAPSTGWRRPCARSVADPGAARGRRGALDPPLGPEVATLAAGRRRGRPLVRGARRVVRRPRRPGTPGRHRPGPGHGGRLDPGAGVDGVAATVRERLDLAAERRALAVQARTSALVLSVAPVGVRRAAGRRRHGRRRLPARHAGRVGMPRPRPRARRRGAWWMTRLSRSDGW